MSAKAILNLRNVPTDVWEAIVERQSEKAKKTKRPVSATEAAYDLMRKGFKCGQKPL